MSIMAMINEQINVAYAFSSTQLPSPLFPGGGGEASGYQEEEEGGRGMKRW